MDASPGAEVWAWFSNKNATDIDQQWKELCGVLSGLLCASFSFIENSNTVQPEFSFRPTFSPGYGLSNSPADAIGAPKSQIRYATLPREIVCTENLTPWKKLLACNHHDGVASLLNSGHIHTTNYHSLGLHVRMLCDGAAKTCSMDSPQQLELRQTVNLVFDKKLLVTNVASQRDWSTRKLFGQGMNGACTLANSSRVYVDMNDPDYILSPAPSYTVLSQRGGATTNYAVYDIKKDYAHQMFNVAAVYKQDKNDAGRSDVVISSPPPLYAKRFLLGVGQERGRIVTKVTNTHWTTLNAILQENLPWFVPVYLHTLTLKVISTGAVIQPKALRFVPGRLRERPSHLEIAFQCPSRATVEISIDFDYVFLKWLEYPPDANHGQYIGSAVLTAALPTARNYTAIPIDGQLFSDSFNASRTSGYVIHLRTESLLISLPTPDFSMPYNVICLACTVVALAFGPIHNVSTKKLSNKAKAKTTDDDAPQTFLGKLKCKLFGKKEKKE